MVIIQFKRSKSRELKHRNDVITERALIIQDMRSNPIIHFFGVVK